VFNHGKKTKILYTKTLNEEMLTHLIKMTPLSWSAAEKEVNEAINTIKSITVDFTMLCGNRKTL